MKHIKLFEEWNGELEIDNQNEDTFLKSGQRNTKNPLIALIQRDSAKKLIVLEERRERTKSVSNYS